MRARHLILLSLLLCAGVAHGQEASTYTVKAGDTLYRIATTNGLTVDELKSLNGLTDNTIRIGQVLVLKPAGRPAVEAEPPEPPEADPAETPETEPAAVAEPVEEITTLGASTYTVQEGETLYSIAAKIGTKAYILYTMNGGVRDPLLPGTTIRVPEGSREGDVALPSVYAAGEVQIFPGTYQGRVMAGGEAYDPASYVVSHPTLPFETVLLVENATSGAVTFARVADRGPLDEDYVMDVSEAVARHLGLQDGRRVVRVRLVE